MQDANQTHLKEATTVSNLADSSLLLAVLKCLKRQVWETTQGLSFVVQREAKEVLCRGSALSKSTYFPNRGTNSCLNLFWAINLVIWLLCLPMGSLSLFFDFSTMLVDFYSISLKWRRMWITIKLLIFSTSSVILLSGLKIHHHWIEIS